MSRSTDYLIVGAGIVGLTIARELLQQGVNKIILLEKEPELASHASGRNSGVLHAGIYYAANSLKAKLCLRGNQLLQEYCIDRNLPLHKTGKVVVARCESELPILDEIYQRAQTNGATVSVLDEKQLTDIEPYAKTHQKALYVHDTAIVDNKKICQSLYQDLNSKHVEVLFGTSFLKMKSSKIAKTSKGDIHFNYLINAAGAYADKIAHHFNVGNEYRMMPFKGIYKKLTPAMKHLVRGNIYPVPNLNYPFLGVHFTKNIHGDVYVGPTAMPAWGPENYGLFAGMGWEGVKIAAQECALILTNKMFRHIASKEIRKYIPYYFYNDAKKLLKELRPEWMIASNKVGIRAQLAKVDLFNMKLVDDFVVEKGENSLHVLNAISPAFTSSMAFAGYIVKNQL